jgi:hypothetical protein
MSTTNPSDADTASPPTRPTITLPPRPSVEAFFAGAASPGPMTLVSSFFATESATFSQLLAGAMASPLAFSSSSSGDFISGKDDDGSNRNMGFKQSRPMNLVIARSPVFTVPPGLSPSGFLNSPGFFSPQVIHPIHSFSKGL